MDLDKSLDDLIPKRKPRGNAGGADRKPRENNRERRDAVPYSRPPPRSTEDKWVHDAYSGPGGERNRRGGRGDRREQDAAGPAFVGPSPRIEVSGIHYEVTADELKSIFSQAGTIVQGPTIRSLPFVYTLQYDRSGRSTGIATVEYATPAFAKLAINKFDGAMTKGQTISIKLIAPPRPTGPARGDSGRSLLQRLGTGDLSARIGGASEQRGPREPRERQQPRERGSAPRGGRGGARGGRAPREKRGPATTDDLDKELDGFMKPDATGDVAMA